MYKSVLALSLAALLSVSGCGNAQYSNAQAQDDSSAQKVEQPSVMHAVDTAAPATTRDRLAQAEPVRAPHAMVVTTQHYASEVGLDILRKGGNAVDAAVAVGYALAVVQPCCGNLGGGGFFMVHLADGTDDFVDFNSNAPLAATAGMFLDKNGQLKKDYMHSYLSVMIPSSVMGLNMALKKYGTMPLKEVIQPAIKLARDGYILDEGDVSILSRYTKEFAKHPNTARIFLNHGKPWKVGDRLKQEDLAKTLERIAKGGTEAFYKGHIAHEIVKASEKHGGVMSLEDFARYKAYWREPIRCNYEGYEIIAAPPPSSGGVTMCQIFGILEPFPLDQWGYGAVKTVHYIAEAERRAFADRNTYLGDPRAIHNPIKKLLAPEHLAGMRDSIDPVKATPSAQVHGSLGASEGMHTTHYSVVDAQGNAVGVTYSINYLFGAGVIPGDTGILLNNGMGDFAAKPGTANPYGLVQGAQNKIRPGKTSLSSMSPTIVLKNGKVFMVTGSPGGPTIISTTLLSILNVVDFGMNIQQAVDAPRMHQQWWPQKVFVEPGLLTTQVRSQLEADGYTFKTVQSWGAAEAILVDPKTGMREGANDRRRGAGLAVGY